MRKIGIDPVARKSFPWNSAGAFGSPSAPVAAAPKHDFVQRDLLTPIKIVFTQEYLNKRQGLRHLDVYEISLMELSVLSQAKSWKSDKSEVNQIQAGPHIISWYVSGDLIVLDRLDILSWSGDKANEDRLLGEMPPLREEQDAPTRAFERLTDKPLCVPEDGNARPYPGKRIAGDVREFLTASYPYSEGAEPLTLSWLEAYDPKAFKALSNQSTSETGPPSAFLCSSRSRSDDLLAKHGLETKTPEGMAEARRIYGILNGRLYGRSRPK